MMWHTHATMGASAAWLLLPFLPPDDPSLVAVLMAFAVVGALMPDLDAAESKIKYVRVGSIKPLVPVARAFNRDFGHRGLLHSIGGWAVWTLLILPLTGWTGWLPVAALSLGYASHLAGDACTRMGIPLFYPRKNRIHLLPPMIQIKTGSSFEEGVFTGFACLTLALLFNAAFPHL